MNYYDTLEILREEDRRFIGNQSIQYDQDSIKISSQNFAVSVIFICLGFGSFLFLAAFYFFLDLSKINFLFLGILFGGFGGVCLLASFLSSLLNQTTLISTATFEANFFLSGKLVLTLPFPKILQTELKRYSLGEGSSTHYPVSLLTEEGKKICLYETTDLLAARKLCETLSKMIRVPMYDASSKEKHLRQVNNLDESVAKRLKKVQLPSDLKLSLKVKKDIEGYKLEDRNPAQQRSGFYALFVGFALTAMCISFFVIINTSKAIEQQDTLILTMFLVPFVLASIAMFFVAAYLFGKRTCLEIDSHSLRYFTKAYGMTVTYEEMLLSKIEEIVLDTSPSQFKEIKIISDEKIISLDSRQLGSVREMYYIKNFINNAILNYLPQGISSSTL